MSFNKIILLGNLTRDIELRYSQGGSAIAKSAIATTRKYNVNGERKEDTTFIDITFFGKVGEIANQYLHKGSKVLIEGRLNFEQWSDQNGQKRSKHSVVVESMQMLDSKGDVHMQPSSGAINQPPPQPQYSHTDYQPQQQAAPQTQANAQRQGGLPNLGVNDEDIPF